MKLKRIAVAVLSLALTAGAVGTVPVTTEAAVKGTITLSGSTSVSPLAQQLAKQFVKENSGVKINFTNITGSGTRSCFEDVLKNDFSLDIAKNYGKLDAEISSTGAMQTSVKSNAGAIGYMSLGDLDSSQVKAVKFNGVAATTTNVANGSYKMSRPFVLATKGTPNAQTAAFIKWCQTSDNAKKIITKMGFVNLSGTNIKPRKITLRSKAKVSLNKGKKSTIKYTVYPANATNKKVTFKSSDKKVATVTKKGVIQAKGKGKTTITITTASGKITKKVQVTVK